MPFDRVIGGHGPMQSGKANVLGMAAYIEEVTAAVERERNKPLPALQSTITPATLKSLGGDYGTYVMTNLGGADPAKSLANGVRSNVAQIYNRLQA
jgi:hypothetical protein